MTHAGWSSHAFAATLLVSTPVVTATRSTTLPPVTITLASTSVVGGVGTTATITLSSVAPPGGTIVTVASAPPVRVSGGSNQVSLAGQIGPTSIRVPQGATQVTINVFTAGVATATTSTITAKSGTDSSVTSLVIRPASIVSLSLSPTIVTGGQSTSLHIVLDGAAPGGTGIDAPLTVPQTTALADGSVRTITPALPSSVNAPATVHFPPGSSTLNVPVSTNPVPRDQSLTLTVQLGTSASAGLTIKAPVASSLSLQPNVVVAGSQTQATVVLNGPAPAGFVVPVATNRPDITVSSPVSVAEGSSSAVFNVVTSPATATSSPVTATVGVIGPTAKAGSIPDGTSNTIAVGEVSFRISVPLTVVPPPAPALELFVLRPTTVRGGTNVIASLKLLSSATSSRTVTLSTDHPELVSLPPTVTVSVSSVATPFTFRTQPTTTQTIATVTAAVGTQQISVRLTISP